ncbi:MAG TPA: hypothetical protein VN441_14270 [Syntrophomonas sp.]|nr:hypothetical protein [Syntrophomonas sp.]
MTERRWQQRYEPGAPGTCYNPAVTMKNDFIKSVQAANPDKPYFYCNDRCTAMGQPTLLQETNQCSAGPGTVELKLGESMTEKEVIDFCRDSLDAYKVQAVEERTGAVRPLRPLPSWRAGT